MSAMGRNLLRPQVAGSSLPPSTLLWPVMEVQQPLGACSATPGPDPI